MIKTVKTKTERRLRAYPMRLILFASCRCAGVCGLGYDALEFFIAFTFTFFNLNIYIRGVVNKFVDSDRIATALFK